MLDPIRQQVIEARLRIIRFDPSRSTPREIEDELEILGVMLRNVIMDLDKEMRDPHPVLRIR